MNDQARTGVGIELIDVVKRYPGQTEQAVQGPSLSIPADETVMFVGPSGKRATLSMRSSKNTSPRCRGEH